MDIKKLIQTLNRLYDYGEVSNDSTLDYLINLKFLSQVTNKYIITRKWIDFSSKVFKEDFISSLVCYYPLYLDYLLSKVYKEAYTIGQSGDNVALFEFVDSVPKFADTIIDLRDKKIEETDEIKLFHTQVFKGYLQYRSILTKLKFMQMAEDIEDTENISMGKTPNDIWVQGRKVSSNIDLGVQEIKNQYTLTPWVYNDFETTEDIKEILSHPWKTFIIIMAMIISEYKAEGVDGVSIRPIDIKNPYTEQELDIYIYDLKGKENKMGSLREFVKGFCRANHLYLFPDKAPEIDKVLFRLMDSKQIIFKDGEYILNPTFDDRLYSQEGIVIKNRSRKFKMILKDYTEGFRRQL